MVDTDEDRRDDAQVHCYKVEGLLVQYCTPTTPRECCSPQEVGGGGSCRQVG